MDFSTGYDMEREASEYIRKLEKQCQDWEKMYVDMKAERDMWKEKYIADGDDSPNKLEAPQQLRHV